MLRTHSCGELRLENCGKEVTLCGWVHKNRQMGVLAFVDLRDRYGITQLCFSQIEHSKLFEMSTHLGREFVIQVKGTVRERSSKNNKITTGDIEIQVSELNILNKAITPPFTIEDETDGGEDLRMKFRYLDIRRNLVRDNLILRHKLAKATRDYLDGLNFIEVETPVLIKSTPEGARDFIVPSRINPGQFYALPQSPQTFKQLLMVAGIDRYFQLVKCFRDEDLRADRQPEFTQIDCEMSFVTRDDILDVFEGMVKYLFEKTLGIQLEEFQRINFQDAMENYGSDKPDLRFGMPMKRLNSLLNNCTFPVFNSVLASQGIVTSICISNGNKFTRKQLDELTEWVKDPKRGMSGLIYVRIEEGGIFKSSVDKFFSQDELKSWVELHHGISGDLLLVLCGPETKTLKAMGDLRLELGKRLGLRKEKEFSCLWVLDFPLVEWGEAEQRWFAMHHPFTAPHPEDIPKMTTNPGSVRANAYDMVINGWEIGGGSIRIHDKALQQQYFKLLGFTEEEAQEKFGFLLNAFEYGAPPHGGIAFGFDRLTALIASVDSIRDVIAFPKNNAGRDTMIEAPGKVDDIQLQDLGLSIQK